MEVHCRNADRYFQSLRIENAIRALKSRSRADGAAANRQRSLRGLPARDALHVLPAEKLGCRAETALAGSRG